MSDKTDDATADENGPSCIDPDCDHDWRDYRKRKFRCANARESHRQKWHDEYWNKKSEQRCA